METVDYHSFAALIALAMHEYIAGSHWLISKVNQQHYHTIDVFY